VILGARRWAGLVAWRKAPGQKAPDQKTPDQKAARPEGAPQKAPVGWPR
jgi:hypothetical protein